MSKILNAARNFHHKYSKLNPHTSLGLDGIEMTHDKHILRIAANIGIIPLASAVYMVPLAMTAMIPGASPTLAFAAASWAGAQTTFDIFNNLLKAHGKEDVKAGLSRLLDGTLNKFGIASTLAAEAIKSNPVSQDVINDINQEIKEIEKQDEINRVLSNGIEHIRDKKFENDSVLTV